MERVSDFRVWFWNRGSLFERQFWDHKEHQGYTKGTTVMQMNLGSNCLIGDKSRGIIQTGGYLAPLSDHSKGEIYSRLQNGFILRQGMKPVLLRTTFHNQKATIF